MSFVDQDRSREKALSGAVTIAVVGCVGYALVTGLAMTVIRAPRWDIPTRIYRSPPPPPPPRPDPVRKATKPAPASHIVVPLPHILPLPIDTTKSATGTQLVPPTTTTTTAGDTGTIDTPPLPKPDLTARARPDGRPGDWVTADDYPASALRAGVEGRTSFRLDLGVDGRATGCTVTQSSGSDDLDRTACRLLERRARFSPALGGDGRPVASSYAGSVVWRAPAD